ncbi:hypothetical protein HA402_016164 [Bradysia odoriphaga]|nr:hypothetical protein HA402_016164 [Bradysia odoriphaga]
MQKSQQVARNIYWKLVVALFRDYGLYDMAQLRFKPGHKINENFYIRHCRITTGWNEINDKIDECLIDFGQPILDRSDLEEEEENRIKITLVKNGENALRGFVGIQELLINVDHFRRKIWCFNDSNENPEILPLILKMDIIAVVVHEYAHLKIRKSTGDFNMQSPIVGQLNGLSPMQHEFGFYAEKKIFGEQIKWFWYEVMDLEFVESFVEAIENQSSLPPGFVRGGVPRHGEMNLDGVDIEEEFYIE